MKRQRFNEAKGHQTQVVLSTRRPNKFAAQAAVVRNMDLGGIQTMDFEKAVQRAVMKEKSKDAGFVDNTGVGLELNTTGTIALVATIAQGASVNQRIGKKAVLKSIQMRGYVVSDTTTLYSVGTLMLVYDRKPTNALPAISDILVSPSSFAFLNDVNSDRFQIVRRWNFNFVGNSLTPGQATDSTAYALDEFVDLKKRPIEFNAAGTGAIGDIAKGAIYIVAVGSRPAGTNDALGSVSFRTRFIDVEG